MQNEDYYGILGVQKNAPPEDIRKAYFRMAKTCHPDIHPTDPSAEGRFKEINEAYEVLYDKEKRRTYDLFGTVDPSTFSAPPMPSLEDILKMEREAGRGIDALIDYSELCGHLYGGGSVDTWESRGQRRERLRKNEWQRWVPILNVYRFFTDNPWDSIALDGDHSFAYNTVNGVYSLATSAFLGLAIFSVVVHISLYPVLDPLFKIFQGN